MKEIKEINGKCKSCLGCNRLEDFNFEGYNECTHYVKRKIYCRRLHANNT